MMRAQVRLSEAAEEPANGAKKVATEIKEEGFGRVHKQHHAKYKAGLDELVAGMQGLGSALTNLGGGIGAAGGKYSAAEDQAAADANKAGSKQ
ncbi:hypothetical protein [Amycolatopsis suaedae]|uniref:Uncharacterized protein n=1 Tax=Amycolatopsis suaedae TaxID=2510978 RepID=A0A4Q7JAR4_9PSEU|nr:hypothetical protein [Amycolatopsis suaedae]RZQ64076.1 hypothetical protein EWH70_08745 [Amycolatopsis suaedae]